MRKLFGRRDGRPRQIFEPISGPAKALGNRLSAIEAVELDQEPRESFLDHS